MRGEKRQEDNLKEDDVLASFLNPFFKSKRDENSIVGNLQHKNNLEEDDSYRSLHPYPCHQWYSNVY